MKENKKLNPDNFDLECTSVWSFPRRGNRATHNSKYRGNWSPDMVRNLILRYSNEEDFLMDPMVGGGTTAIECKLLNRNLKAYDINPKAIKLTKEGLNFDSGYYPSIEVKKGDATKKKKNIDDESIDFILTHPPY